MIVTMDVSSTSVFGVVEIIMKLGLEVDPKTFGQCLAEHGIVCVFLEKWLDKARFAQLASSLVSIKMPSYTERPIGILQ